jgi:hypothetical protein
VLSFPVQDAVEGIENEGGVMSSEITDRPKRVGFRLSLDTWAVLLALVLAAAVRFHILKAVPW